MAVQLQQASTQLRLKLLSIILCLLTPLALFQALEFYQVRATRTRITQERALELAKTAAARLQDVIDDAQSTLDLIAKMSDVAAGREWNCSQALADVAKSRPWVRHIGVVDDRKVICSTNPASIGFDVSRRDWFRAAEQDGGFSVSDFLVSEVSLVPSTFAAYFPHQGSRRAYIINFDLTWLDRLAESIAEDRDIAIVAVDSRGVALARYPKSSIPGHAKLSPELMRQIDHKGLFESPDLDGKHRFFGSFKLARTKAHVLVGFDRAAALSLIDRYILIAAVLFTVILLAGAYFAWTIGDRMFIQPIGRLNTLLRTTLDTMDQGLIALDDAGRAVVINRQACQLLDLPQEFQTRNPHQSEILAYQNGKGEFEDQQQFRAISSAIETRSAGVYERRRPNGTIIEVRTVPAAGGFVRTYTDVTARRGVEEAIKLERDKAAAAARAASEFLANMSHELRTPLTAILALADLLKDDTNSAQRDLHVDLQQAAARNLLALINDILDFSKIESGGVRLETVAFSLDGLVRTSIALLSPRADEKGLAINVELDAAAPDWVEGDPLRLQQIIVNLLANAVKFTAQGSVLLSVTAVNGHLRFAVEDTGIGIERADIDHLFERFKQVDSSTARKFGGSGLGLAISQALARLMDSRIQVASEPGRGSKFWFSVRLPACAPPMANAPKCSADIVRSRLLLVEDNDINRSVLAQMLESRGHSVVRAADGLQAIDCATSQTFDAILMDIRMPGMDGHEAARRIKCGGLNAHTPVFALTADVVAAGKHEWNGFTDVIAKPVDWSLLDDKLSRLQAMGGPHQSRSGGDVADTRTQRQLEASIGHANFINLLSLFAADARQRFTSVSDPMLAEEAHSFGGSAGLMGFLKLSLACSTLVDAIGGDGDVASAFTDCCRHRDDAFAEAERLIATSRAHSRLAVSPV